MMMLTSLPLTEASRRVRRCAALVTLCGLATALLLSPVGSVRAQARAADRHDARWLPWIGCWQRSADANSNASLTCVRPDSGSAADILTVADGKIEAREHLVVDGQPHPIAKDGCSGTETATWSSTGSRIYIGAAYSCSGSLRGRSTRMFAILPSGVWLEVRDVHSGGGWVETVTRFHDAGLPSSVPAGLRSEISHQELAISTARAAASAPATASDIAEATQAVDTAVVQSWLAARGQAVASDATTAPNVVRVYTGSAPPPEPTAPAEPLETGCDPFGCYAPNTYSTYNGAVFTPYARTYSSYGFGPSYYVPYVAPVVIVRGSRGAFGRPPVIHAPINHRPAGHSPGGNNPGGYNPGGRSPGGRRPIAEAPPVYTPSSAHPASQSPRIGLPGRIRP